MALDHFSQQPGYQFSDNTDMSRIKDLVHHSVVRFHKMNKQTMCKLTILAFTSYALTVNNNNVWCNDKHTKYTQLKIKYTSQI